ncbi:hypothetical protein [Paenibacillus guangzhouensis]|uniref:hypothetical protein n=1 Tax=Paenibacillus guangzhouensis TaxID=1473112 RepID=UPI001266AEEF|nr:hypothetical protein [Paenibacillus guangzhouensis]
MEMKLHIYGKMVYMASLMIALIWVGGCSSVAESPEQPLAFNQASDGQSGPDGPHRSGMFQKAPDQPDRNADVMAKVVAVEGTDITIQRSKMDPGARMGGGQRSQGNGEEGRQAPAQSSGDGGEAADKRRVGGGGREMQFNEEKQHIQIPEGTPIYTMSWTDGTMAYKQLTVKELKADDVITVWINPDAQEQASYVTVRSGGTGFPPMNKGTESSSSTQ